MKFQLFKCEKCVAYTFKTICSQCGGDTKLSHPAKYSPDDKYARYRLAENYD
ncbi:MAG: ribosome biogenesis protein [Cenarchaeum symbiont of Oopsacas minuta]|nr:ribosome biogenesis protein [Cenarchaeum symbiont of Oopsacas minuta]